MLRKESNPVGKADTIIIIINYQLSIIHFPKKGRFRMLVKSDTKVNKLRIFLRIRSFLMVTD